MLHTTEDVPLRITVLGHASALLESGGARILVDPIFVDTFASDTLRFVPERQIDESALVRDLSALVVTHAHLDHYHPATLAKFPRSTPIVVPPHDFLIAEVRKLGFERLIPLAAWERVEFGPIELLATPSDFEWAELGLVAKVDSASYWHMSDCIVDTGVGERVRRELGPISLVAAKYTPLRTLVGYQRGMQSMMLDREELIAGFEAACAAMPNTIFPYSFGFAFAGEYAWANRFMSPYGAEEVARMLARRLGEDVSATCVRPGDVFEVNGRSVRQLRGAARFVRERDHEPAQTWEPIDPQTLLVLQTQEERAELERELADLMLRGVVPWTLAHIADETGLFDAYRALQTVWQAVVHTGPAERIHHAIDFRADEPRYYPNFKHPDANVFSHIAGGSLLRVLKRQAGAELFWMAGGYRQYEKIIMISEGRFAAPKVAGWDLFEQLPEPITHYLRKMGSERLVA